MTSTTYLDSVDLRQLAPRERHPLIFSSFNNLPLGETMELVNDHDPRPLHAQFLAQMPGQFTWDAVESGPDTWRVAITKIAVAQAHEPCCGSCSCA
jgi:uncharacterized protein (DUF2249 family)